MTDTICESRNLTPAELAQIIIHQRQERKWTQDVVAELAGITMRTVQRVENAEASSFDTRRALARAFEWEDIDVFNKPWPIPNVEKIRQEMERLEKETTTLSLEIITTGRRFREAIELGQARAFDQLCELSSEAEEIFAEIQDYARDYGDIHEEYSATQKLEVNQDFQRMIDSLAQAGISVGIGTRRMYWISGNKEASAPIGFTVVHVVVGTAKAFPQTIRIPKKAKMGF